MKKKLVSLVLCIAMVASLCVSLTGCGTKKTNLADYITISVSDHNEHGYATYEIDYESLAEDSGLTEAVYKDMQKGGTINNSYGFSPSDDAEKMVKNYFALADYYFEFEKNEYLSNGETVTLNIFCDENAKGRLDKALGVNITAPEKVTYTIGKDELPERTIIDPFEFLTVKFSGENGYGTIEFVVNETKKTFGEYTVYGNDKLDTLNVVKEKSGRYFEYYINKINGEHYGSPYLPKFLKNGDTVVVNIKIPINAGRGYDFSPYSKEYKVTGLKSN